MGDSRIFLTLDCPSTLVIVLLRVKQLPSSKPERAALVVRAGMVKKRGPRFGLKFTRGTEQVGDFLVPFR